MSALLELPQELLINVLTFLNARDLVTLGQTCKAIHSSIDPVHNQQLWRSTFLHAYDDPITAYRQQRSKVGLQQREWDWFKELKHRFLATRLLDRHTEKSFAYPLGEEEMVHVLLDMIDTSYCDGGAVPTEGKHHLMDVKNSQTIQCLPDRDEYSIAMDQLVRESRLIDPEVDSAMEIDNARPITRSMSANRPRHPRTNAEARLHVLAGVTVREERDRKAMGRARRVVYDLSRTNERTEWSPCKDDGSGEIDWIRLEAVMTVGVRSFQNAIRGRMTLPQGFKYSIPYRSLIPAEAPNDWARATGNWCGTYVFLNWNDLLDFNVFNGPTASQPNLEDAPEQCGGLMKLELHLDDTITEDPALKTHLPFCDDLPPLYFSGLSKSYDWSLATAVRGRVCLAPGGREVRWKFIVR